MSKSPMNRSVHEADSKAEISITGSRRYAIYGGSFDPIHVGHVALAEHAVRECGLDKLIFMPAYTSPFKQDRHVTDGRDRCGMIETVLAQNKAFCLSRYEVTKAGPSYTIETLRYWKKLLGGDLGFVLGFDSVIQLDKWYMGEEILRDYHLIAARRPDTDDTEGMKIIEGFRQKYGSRITILDMAPVDASSTEIREKISAGESVSGLVTPGVEKYIREHGLYMNSELISESDRQRLEEFMKSNLKESRYRHSLGVEEMAVKLAKLHGGNAAKAAFAGRYHDIAKCFDIETMDAYIAKYDLPRELLGNNALAHSKVAAAILEHEFGVNDREVLDAVRYHTTARKDMSLLEEIVYTADVVEDNRTYDDLAYYQDLAYRDLDQACLEILEYTIADLAGKGRPLDRDTAEAKEYIEAKLKQRANKSSKN